MSPQRAVHTHGVVHGDVKPGNVFVTDDGTAKLADFGISHVIGGAVTLTDSGLVSGTPAHVAPEVARHDKPIPPQTSSRSARRCSRRSRALRPMGRATMREHCCASAATAKLPPA
nr:protein kinase [Allokutzneria sp. NRRL B-24872]